MSTQVVWLLEVVNPEMGSLLIATKKRVKPNLVICPGRTLSLSIQDKKSVMDQTNLKVNV